MSKSLENHYVGCDVSDKTTAICIVNYNGEIVDEGSIPSDPTEIGTFIKKSELPIARIGIEASNLSIWLCRSLLEAGFPVICVETHKASAFLAAQKMKTDKNDARGLAQMMRCGLYNEVHIKSDANQRIKMLVNNRRFLVSQRVDTENQIRGSLKVFGLKVGSITEHQYDGRVREIISGDGELEAAVLPLLEQRASGILHVKALDRMLLTAAKNDEICRLLMTAPGVGHLTAILYKAVIDDPLRFQRSKDVPAQLGLVPRKYASGEMDYNGRITKAGDSMLRQHLYTAAVSLTKHTAKPCALKRWGRELRNRGASYKSSNVAVARKLSIILHRMWVDGAEYDWSQQNDSSAGVEAELPKAA